MATMGPPTNPAHCTVLRVKLTAGAMSVSFASDCPRGPASRQAAGQRPERGRQISCPANSLPLRTNTVVGSRSLSCVSVSA